MNARTAQTGAVVQAALDSFSTLNDEDKGDALRVFNRGVIHTVDDPATQSKTADTAAEGLTLAPSGDDAK